MKTKLACLFVLGLLAAGCGKNKMVEASENYEKAACACKDTACITAATTKFGQESTAAASSSPSSSDAEAITKSTTAATTCVTKIAMAGMPAMPGMPAK